MFLKVLALLVASVGLLKNPSILAQVTIKNTIAQQQIQAKEALKYCKSHKMNTNFCILIDMRIHSGLNRFIVWDFKKDTIAYSCLVSHGCCNNPWSQDASKKHPLFSNQDGSHCSSIGKYKIGARGPSSWGIGIKYLLHGLEATNSNALARAVVLHGWDAIPDQEIFPKGTPEGWGCPSVSNNSMRFLDAKLRNLKVPVLLWIYN
jgi:hypothetical protein